MVSYPQFMSRASRMFTKDSLNEIREIDEIKIGPLPIWIKGSNQIDDYLSDWTHCTQGTTHVYNGVTITHDDNWYSYSSWVGDEYYFNKTTMVLHINYA